MKTQYRSLSCWPCGLLQGLLVPICFLLGPCYKFLEMFYLNFVLGSSTLDCLKNNKHKIIIQWTYYYLSKEIGTCTSSKEIKLDTLYYIYSKWKKKSEISKHQEVSPFTTKTKVQSLTRICTAIRFKSASLVRNCFCKCALVFSMEDWRPERAKFSSYNRYRNYISWGSLFMQT